jgi:hypothetical protein
MVVKRDGRREPFDCSVASTGPLAPGGPRMKRAFSCRRAVARCAKKAR